jgi:hypothetical protein
MPANLQTAARIGTAVLMLSNAAFAQTVPTAPRPPLVPGGVRLTTKVPDPDNWIPRFAKGKTTYTCKPLACADSVSVTIVTARSPTRNPNPQALDKLAKVDLPKRLKAITAAAAVLSEQESRFDTLSAKVTSMLGYPAVEDEMKLTRGKIVAFMHITVIFAGPLMVTVSSASPNRTVATKSADDFIGGIKVEVGPSLPPRLPVVPPTEAPTKI